MVITQRLSKIIPALSMLEISLKSVFLNFLICVWLFRSVKTISSFAVVF